MRRFLRTISLATAAIGAAVGLYLVLTLPPASMHLAGTVPPTVAVGAYHIHSTRSDGTGTVDAIAGAAGRAGLKFVILTDHGDATRTPDAPAYTHGVLVIDAVEISCDQGHLVALGLNGPAPYPLAGDAAAVIDDVHRLGGVAVIAHPDSPNPDLRWRGPVGAADGIEWLNVDSEWRDDPPTRLLAMTARSFLRPAESIAALWTRPARSLQRWDLAQVSAPRFSLAAVDAHARIGWREAEEPRSRTALAWPSYEAVFRTIVQGVELDTPLSGDAATDARRVIAAIAAGRSFSLVRAYAAPAHIEFSATRDGRETPMGGHVDGAAPVTLRASVPEAAGARLALLRDGREVAHASGTLSTTVSEAGIYRVEVTLPIGTAPWIVSNAITVGDVRTTGPAGAPSAESPSGADPTPLQPLVLDSPWTIEHDASSMGTVAEDAGATMFGFRLGAGTPAGQYAALTTSVHSLIGADRVTFTARADRPMRASVQLRLPGGKDGQRWRQSVYFDTTPRVITVRLQDLVPAGATTSRRPFAAPIQGLLVVVDTVNTKTGAAGTLWISAIQIGGR